MPFDQLEAKAGEGEFIRALLAETWMLVDYISGLSNQGLKRVDVFNPKTKTVYTPAELLDALDAMQERADAGALEPGDRSGIELVRDALNLLIAPASGLTVAYTTMVSGPLRATGVSRFTLARLAYPGLVGLAWWHKGLQIAMLVLALVLTGTAGWESAKVALGKALLQNLDVLQTKQATLETAKTKLEIASGPADPRRAALEHVGEDSLPPLLTYRVCDRPLVVLARSRGQPIETVLAAKEPRLLSYESAEAAELCGQDDVLRVNLGIAHDDINSYVKNWAVMMIAGEVLKVEPDRREQRDAEFRAAPVLLVWGNFVLPIIFSTIGSIIFVILDHYTKVRINVLDPRDFQLAPIRFALGLVVGACVGLFFSASGPAPGSTAATGSALISSLTLTASGVAFLAGFGVETVFTLLDATIKRVFTLPAPSKP